MKQEFYRCSHCGNIIAFVENKGVPVMCCGQKMEKIIPNSTDAAGEKHVPVINQDGRNITVTVGSVKHPMLPEHFIEWISIETDKGNQRKVLHPDSEPKAEFVLLEDEHITTAYAYCNLHGLWKADA